MAVSLLSYLDMFEYFKKARAKLVVALEKMPNEEFTKNRGLSFDSIKDVFVHTVMVEDNWLHYRFAGLGTGTDRKLQDFKNIEDVKKYIAEVDAKTAKLFGRITEQDLRKPVKSRRPDGTETVYPLEQVLFHLPIEIIYHFGEIFAEFWKMNLDVPYYSYLAYSKEKT
jgi:uncharacterized damage-inducible protein DinB